MSAFPAAVVRRILAGGLAAAAVLLVLGVTPSAQATTCSQSSTNWTKSSGLSFGPGAFCRYDLNVGSRAELIFQTDGNLVIYNNGTAYKASNTAGVGHRLALQTDGNIVVYDASGRARWASGVYGSTYGYQLDLQSGEAYEYELAAGGGVFGGYLLPLSRV